MNAVAIGNRIKTLRKAKDISRENFCKSAEITLSALSMYENGKRIPRDEIKLKIARVLDSTIEDIFFAK